MAILAASRVHHPNFHHARRPSSTSSLASAAASSIQVDIGVRTLTYEQLAVIVAEIPDNEQRWWESLPDEALLHIIEGRPMAPIYARYGRPGGL